MKKNVWSVCSDAEKWFAASIFIPFWDEAKVMNKLLEKRIIKGVPISKESPYSVNRSQRGTFRTVHIIRWTGALKNRGKPELKSGDTSNLLALTTTTI